MAHTVRLEPSNLFRSTLGKWCQMLLSTKVGLWPWEKGGCCSCDSIEYENSSWGIYLCCYGISFPFVFKRAWIFCSVSYRFDILLVNLFSISCNPFCTPCKSFFTTFKSFCIALRAYVCLASKWLILSLTIFYTYSTLSPLGPMWEWEFILLGVLHWPGGIYFEGSTLGDDIGKVTRS